uniref:Pentapeptide repeat protein n=1 Tax=Cyanothece sp. (strain PCC 7425 / ATCC 29141) TaxID=395961 RepID=B8HYD6_CYAP4
MRVLRSCLLVSLLTCCLFTLSFFNLSPLAAWGASSSAIRSFAEVKALGKNLAGQNLEQVEFGDARLSGANLSGANLRGAVFNAAVLTGANLQGVNFSDGIGYLCDFSDADLENAVLDSAMLLKSEFKGAKINGADFSFALLDRPQVLQLCEYASGVNPTTGVSTRESLGCP